jgi:hypothetical protein
MTSTGPLARRTISEVILQATMIEVHILRAILVSCYGFLVYLRHHFAWINYTMKVIQLRSMIILK